MKQCRHGFGLSNGCCHGDTHMYLCHFQQRYMQPCVAHDHETMVPLIISSHMPSFYASASAASPETEAVVETRELRRRLLIPGSGLRLLHRSTSSPAGAKSFLHMRLTPMAVAPSLVRVHLSVRLSGTLFLRTLDADPCLEFVYAWDRRNAYNQKVYGVAKAKVAIGYEYTGCDRPIWIARVVVMKAHDVDVSGIGEGWNLEVQHHYNVAQGKTSKRKRHFSPIHSMISCNVGDEKRFRATEKSVWSSFSFFSHSRVCRPFSYIRKESKQSHLTKPLHSFCVCASVRVHRGGERTRNRTGVGKKRKKK